MNVTKCSACGQDHEDVALVTERRPNGDSFFNCPTTGRRVSVRQEPVLPEVITNDSQFVIVQQETDYKYAVIYTEHDGVIPSVIYCEDQKEADRIMTEFETTHMVVMNFGYHQHHTIRPIWMQKVKIMETLQKHLT